MFLLYVKDRFKYKSRIMFPKVGLLLEINGGGMVEKRMIE
jgi:hypothetical protein